MFNAHIRELQQAVILLEEAETGQRGYLLTGNNRYLESYERGVKQLPKLLDTINRATDKDSVMITGISRIRELSTLKLDELAETIELYDSGRSAAALRLVQTDRGQQFMEQLRSEISTLSDSLAIQRDAADARVLNGNTSVKRWALLTVLALIVSVAFFTRQVYRLGAERGRFEKRIMAQSSILNVVIDEIPAIVSIWDQHQTCCLVNKAYESWRGQSRGSMIGLSIRAVIGDDEYQKSGPHVERVFRGEVVRYEKHYPGAAIEFVSFTLTPLFLEGGEVCGMIAMGQDATSERAEHDRLRRLSESDSLTGVLNRAGFDRYLQERMIPGIAENIGLLYIDLDHFKPVNDRYGHATGDEVLRVVAHRFRHLVRTTDTVARLGGDEFAIVLNAVRNQREVQQIANKIVAAARKPIAVGEHVIRIGASVGASFDASQAGGWQSLVERADASAYQAKRNGRGQAKIYVPHP